MAPFMTFSTVSHLGTSRVFELQKKPCVLNGCKLVITLNCILRGVKLAGLSVDNQKSSCVLT